MLFTGLLRYTMNKIVQKEEREVFKSITSLKAAVVVEDDQNILIQHQQSIPTIICTMIIVCHL